MGRPAIVAISIGGTVVRIPVARGAIGIVRIAAKAQALELHPFSPPSAASGAAVPMPGLAARRRIPATKIYLFSHSTSFTEKNSTATGRICPAHCVGLGCACGADCVRLRLLKASLGRPANGAISIGGTVVRNPVARGARGRGRIAAKAQAYPHTGAHR